MTIPSRLDKYAQDCRTFPADAVLAYRLEGVKGAWDALRQRTIDRILYTSHVIVFAQLIDSAPEVPPPPGVVIRRLQEGDGPALATMVSQRNLARFRALAAAGRHGLIAWCGARPLNTSARTCR